MLDRACHSLPSPVSILSPLTSTTPFTISYLCRETRKWLTRMDIQRNLSHNSCKVTNTGWVILFTFMCNDSCSFSYLASSTVFSFKNKAWSVSRSLYKQKVLLISLSSFSKSSGVYTILDDLIQATECDMKIHGPKSWHWK